MLELKGRKVSFDLREESRGMPEAEAEMLVKFLPGQRQKRELRGDSSWYPRLGCIILVPARGGCGFGDELPERERGSFQASEAPEYV